MEPGPTRPFAEVSMIAEWINRACCERLVAWDVDKDARARRLPFYGRTHTPLDIALMRSGRAREDECEAALVAAGPVRDDRHTRQHGRVGQNALGCLHRGPGHGPAGRD